MVVLIWRITVTTPKGSIKTDHKSNPKFNQILNMFFYNNKNVYKLISYWWKPMPYFLISIRQTPNEIQYIVKPPPLNHLMPLPSAKEQMRIVQCSWIWKRASLSPPRLMHNCTICAQLHIILMRNARLHRWWGVTEARTATPYMVYNYIPFVTTPYMPYIVRSLLSKIFVSKNVCVQECLRSWKCMNITRESGLVSNMQQLNRYWRTNVSPFSRTLRWVIIHTVQPYGLHVYGRTVFLFLLSSAKRGYAYA